MAQQYTAFAEPDDTGSRDDPGYVQWYLDHGKAYQQADPGRVSHASSVKSFHVSPACCKYACMSLSVCCEACAVTPS